MNCPFCKVNYDSEALVDGRCPNCSGIVSWQGDKSDEFDSDSFSPMVTVSLGPFPNPGVSRPKHNPTSLNSSAPKSLGSELPSDSPQVTTGSNVVAPGQRPPESDAGKNPDATDPTNVMYQNKTNDASLLETPKFTSENASSPPQQDANTGPNDGIQGDADHDTDGSLGRNRRMLNSGAVKKLNRMWRTATAHHSGTLSTIRSDFESDPQSIQVVINERKMNGKNQSALSADYELIEQIGQGAVGVVYAAQQSSIDRQVAVKMLHQQADISDEQKEKFLFEAVVTGDLDHPNIVPIHELGKNQTDDLFYSMKKIDGQPWSESVSKKSLSENLDILMKVCDAVAFAHSRGVVHRDLKPENIMLGEFGEVLVVDWGIALPIVGFSKSELLQSRPSVSGTPAYMAPEMATGPIEKIGIRSDVYLLGAILFEILCRKPPHNGKSTMDCVMAAANNRIAPTDITEEPMSIAMKALETEPANRYASVPDFQAALREYQSHIESITLSDRADAAFTQAIETKDYPDFSRASYAYTEALELWESNEAAKEGLRKTNLAYAKCALEKSDFDLGLSLIDSEEEEFAPVANALRAGVNIRDRRQSLIKTLRTVAIMLVLLIVVGGYWAYWIQVESGKSVSRALEDANKSLSNEKVALKKAKLATKEALEATEKERKSVEEKEQALEKVDESLKAEKAAKQDAEKAKEQAVENLTRLAEKTYISEIGAASEKISLNAFSAARKIAVSTKEKSSGLLHWEWGRINQICNGESREFATDQLLNDELVESLAVRRRTTNQKELLAVGRATGQVDLINTKQDQKISTIDFIQEQTGKVSEVAFSPDGDLLVVAGQIGNRGIAKIWKADRTNAAPVVLPPHGTKINSVAFDPSGKMLLTAADDKSLKLWQLNDLTLIRTFTGHLGPVWDCDFAPNGVEFVSASEDGTVRVWSIGASIPNRRFAEHQGPVYCVRFLKDGTRLASAGADKKVLRWTIASSSFSEAGTQDENASLIQATKRRVDRLLKQNNSDDPKTVENSGLRREESDSQILGTHENAVRVLEVSSDGRTLVSGGDDNLVKLWDLGNGTSLDAENVERTLKGHGSWIRGAAFSSNNKTIFSGGYDREIRIWDLNSPGNTIEILSENKTLACAVSPNGNRLVTTTEDGKAKVWDAKTGEELALLQDGHRFLSTTALVTNDESMMFTAAGDNTVRVWDFQAGIEMKTINNTGRRSLLSLSRDGRRFATGENGEKAIRIFDVKTGELVQRCAPDILVGRGSENSVDITTFALSEDGSYVIAGDSYGVCYLWNVENNRLIAKWRGHFAAVVSTYFTSGIVAQSDELTFVTAGREGIAATWSFSTDATLEIDPEKQLRVKLSETQFLIRNALTKRTINPLTSMIMDPDRENIVITTQVRNNENKSMAAEIAVINLSSGERSSVNMDNTKIQSVCFHPNKSGEVLIAASSFRLNEKTNGSINASVVSKTGSLLYRWDRGLEPEPRPYLRGPDLSRVANMNLLPAGNQLLLVGGKGVRQWDLDSGNLTREFRSHGKITCVAFSPSSNLVATGGVEKTVKVWDVTSAKSILKFQSTAFDKISAVHFLNEKTVLISDESGQVFVANIAMLQKTELQPLIENGSRVNSICISPNQKLLFLGGDDGLVNVWNIETNTKLETLKHSDRVLCVAISNDGRLLATGTANNLGHIWNTTNWTKTGELTGHAAPVTSVNFSTDRIRLLSASQDGNSSVWDLTPTLKSTEPLVDNEDDLTEPVHQLTEVFTLTENTDPLVGAFFVNDGRSVATCCVNGLTTIFCGSDIEPSLRLTRSSIEIKPNDTTALDPAILVVCPTNNLLNAFEINVNVEDQADGSPAEYFSLALSDSTEQQDRHFKVVDGSVLQREYGDSKANTEWRSVGEATIASKTIRFRFTNLARIETIESVLRSIECNSSERLNSPRAAKATYKFKARPDSRRTETYSILLRTVREPGNSSEAIQ